MKRRKKKPKVDTIDVHFPNGEPTTLNYEEYKTLCRSGMMWEFHPDAPLHWPYPIDEKFE